MNPFALFAEPTNFWSFNDYQAVLTVMSQTRSRFVLEFGPGASTLALIEGGARRVDTCEADPTWAEVYRPRLEKPHPPFYGFVMLHEYTYEWPVPLSIPAVNNEVFDLALIDGPHCTEHRALAVRYALDRCQHVLVPTEDEGRRESSYLRPILVELAAEYGFSIRFLETGPISGGFALLTRVP